MRNQKILEITEDVMCSLSKKFNEELLLEKGDIETLTLRKNEKGEIQMFALNHHVTLPPLKKFIVRKQKYITDYLEKGYGALKGKIMKQIHSVIDMSRGESYLMVRGRKIKYTIYHSYEWWLGNGKEKRKLNKLEIILGTDCLQDMNTLMSFTDRELVHIYPITIPLQRGQVSQGVQTIGEKLKGIAGELEENIDYANKCINDHNLVRVRVRVTYLNDLLEIISDREPVEAHDRIHIYDFWKEFKITINKGNVLDFSVQHLTKFTM